MVEHQFGGDWTEEKLERVRKYLCEYTKIFARNPKASHFETIYVDAFAGTGLRAGGAVFREEADFFGDSSDGDRDALKKGSARIALEVEPPFASYLFIDQKPEHTADLRALAEQFPDKRERIKIMTGEANQLLTEWCRSHSWRHHRAVVFLDPYGMQVEWATLEAIARTRAIDLWLLFPLGVAVNRLLTREGPPPPEWGQALSRIFGTDDWRSEFYVSTHEVGLFETTDVERRHASLEDVARFFLRRLRGVFAGVADNPRPLLNSKGHPIYLLCFAAGNRRGAPIALRIAQHILRG